jgi:hypothetical protein
MATRTDDFNRTASTTTIQSPSDGGANWTLDPSDAVWGVKTNGGYLVTRSASPIDNANIGYSIIRWDLGGKSCDLTLVDVRGATNASFFSSIWFGYTPANGTGYFLEFDGSSHWTVYKYDGAGTNTLVMFQLTGSNVAFPTAWNTAAGGGTVTLRVTLSDAGVIAVYQNGTKVGQITDTTYSGTWVGIGSNAASTDSSSELYDSFTAIHTDPMMVPARQPVPPMAVFRAAVM